MRTQHRRIRNKLDAGERAFGVTVQLPSPEQRRDRGIHRLRLRLDRRRARDDGPRDISDLMRAADAVGYRRDRAGARPLPSFIQRVLDAGATGVMAPHMRTAADAAAIVSAAKFEPQGTRGACPATRAVGHLTEDWVADYKRADRDTLVFGLIEDVEGVENVAAIAARPRAGRPGVRPVRPGDGARASKAM